MSLEDQLNVPSNEVVHNNIPLTNVYIKNLISQVIDNDYMSQIEKDRVVQMLNHCIISTNGRSPAQKIQDLTEILANIAGYTTQSSMHFKKVEMDLQTLKSEITHDVNDKFEKFMNGLADRVEKKIDKLSNSLDMRSQDVAALKVGLDKLEKHVHEHDKQYVPQIATLQHEVKDIKNDLNDESNIQDQQKTQPVDNAQTTTWLQSFTKIALDRPQLMAFIIGSTLLALSFSTQFHELVSKLIAHF